MMRITRKIIAWALVVTLIATIGMIYFTFFHSRVKTGDIITTFTDLNRLEVRKVTLSTNVSIFEGKNSMIASVIGDVYITVDFDKATIKYMDRGKKIYFSLPSPETNKCVIHEALSTCLVTDQNVWSKLKDFFTSNSLGAGADLYKAALEEAQNLLEEKVRNDEAIMADAKSITEDILNRMCSDLGVIPIINWY